MTMQTDIRQTVLDHLVALCVADPERALYRHKRGGIWHVTSRIAFLQRITHAAEHLRPLLHDAPSTIVSVAENSPELYAAILAAPALGARIAPLCLDFLERFGWPKGLDPTLVVVENEATLQAFDALVGAHDWPVVLLDALAPQELLAGDPHGVDAVSALARMVVPEATALIAFDSGENGPPVPTPLCSQLLIETAKANINLLDIKGEDTLLGFLPLCDAVAQSLALVVPTLTGASVNCIEGTSTFFTDLREVAPTHLVAPARAIERIDREISDRLPEGGWRRRLLEQPGSLARAFLADPLLHASGLNRCRFLAATEELPAPAASRRLGALGLKPVALGAAPNGALSRSIEGASACLLLEAGLRNNPLVARARVSGDKGQYRAEIVPDFTQLARIADESGIVAPNRTALIEHEGVLALYGATLTTLNATLVDQPGITGLTLRDSDFPPAMLTLAGAPRRGRAAAVLSGARPGSPGVPTTGAGQRRAGEVILRLEDISLSFGGVRALSNVSLDVCSGEILSIIGPNGAGKTSMLNVINGVYHPTSGFIDFLGVQRRRMRPAQAARSGIGRTFQHVSLFRGMSVLDNLMVGRSARFAAPLVSRALRLGRSLDEEVAERIAVEQVLAFLDLEGLRHTAVEGLPYGVQKRIELGRALATQPRLLLLDEPMAGMTYEEKQDMCGFIRAVNDAFGTTILLIEHDIGVVMGLSDRVVVLNYGRKIADGGPAEVSANPEVIAAYLGTSAGSDLAAGQERNVA